MKRLLPSLLLAITLPLAAQFSLDSDKREGKPILINSDAMSVDIEKGIATFFGNVIVNDPQVIITCKKMVLYQEPKSKTAEKKKTEQKKKKNNDPLSGEGSKLERIECIDDVVITRKDSGDKNHWGTCGKAVYYHKQGSITMTIEPILYQDDSKITGTRLTFYTDSKQIEGSDVRITARNLGDEKNNPKNPDKKEKSNKKTDADLVDDFYNDGNAKAPAANSGASNGRVKRKLTQKEADAILGFDKAPAKDK